ncbi:MAG: putative lipid II flippase FtsW [Candidatus Omnitrophica bacterium]|nr:putative lipid II flippase FtsW [Candidatus Omnitrophota bacterium]
MQNSIKNIYIITAILICIGVIMVYSSSAMVAYERYKDSTYFLKRHCFYLLIGLALALFLMATDYRKLQKFSKPLLFFSGCLLLLILLKGREIGGAKRWFRFGQFSFQPSEFAKLSLMIYLSDCLARKQARIKNFLEGFIPPAMVAGAVILLVLLQPDLGTAIAISAITGILFFVAGIDLRYILLSLLAMAPVLYVAIFSAPYRRRRILAFLNPWQDPRGIGFQVIQSFLALGSGGLLGMGLGRSRQKLFYLPESHTDFIISIIGEELGLIGTASVMILFILFLWQGMKISFNCRDLFGKFLSLGIVSMISLEAVINIGAGTGAIPTKGLPLPFISYGGTSLMFHVASIGLLLNIAKTCKAKV